MATDGAGRLMRFTPRTDFDRAGIERQLKGLSRILSDLLDAVKAENAEKVCAQLQTVEVAQAYLAFKNLNQTYFENTGNGQGALFHDPFTLCVVRGFAAGLYEFLAIDAIKEAQGYEIDRQIEEILDQEYKLKLTAPTKGASLS